MQILDRFRKRLPKDKTKEELDKHYEGLELEKGDFLAMIIAAVITFLPVVLIAMTVIYGSVWLLFIR
jgi:hypothetical protein